MTWVPLVGAAVVAGGHWDQDISNWAVEQTPVFGSPQQARDYSDIGQAVLIGEGFGTSLLTPSGDDAGEWLWNKARGVTVEAAGFGLTSAATMGLKGAVNRERPDQSGDDSMPSGHTSGAFSGATLANRNLDHIELHPAARTGLKAVNIGLASSVGWARIEGEKHFPTDVLVGAALGSFVTRFVHDAFLGLKADDKFTLYVEPTPSSFKALLSWEF